LIDIPKILSKISFRYLGHVCSKNLGVPSFHLGVPKWGVPKWEVPMLLIRLQNWPVGPFGEHLLILFFYNDILI
jgi:hypothetical protein